MKYTIDFSLNSFFQCSLHVLLKRAGQNPSYHKQPQATMHALTHPQTTSTVIDLTNNLLQCCMILQTIFGRVPRSHKNSLPTMHALTNHIWQRCKLTQTTSGSNVACSRNQPQPTLLALFWRCFSCFRAMFNARAGRMHCAPQQCIWIAFLGLFWCQIYIPGLCPSFVCLWSKLTI